MSRIVMLAGSMRRGGNTDMLAEAFAQGAARHNEVDIISVADLKVGVCVGCNTCFTREGHACFQKDDMGMLYEKLRTADVLVIATPVYFYGISAALKAIVDRLHTPMRNTFGIRRMGLLAVGAATLPELFDAIKVQYRLVLNYFGLEDVGMVLASGCKDKGDILHTGALDEARALGEIIR